jgi:hypothetical protein
MLQNIIQTQLSKHTCIEFGCICGLILAGKYLNFIGNVRRSFVEINQG